MQPLLVRWILWLLVEVTTTGTELDLQCKRESHWSTAWQVNPILHTHITCHMGQQGALPPVGSQIEIEKSSTDPNLSKAKQNVEVLKDSKMVWYMKIMGDR